MIEIPIIEDALECNVIVVDIDNMPEQGSNIVLNNSLMYKSLNKNTTSCYLLYDNGHYSFLNNIRGLLACKRFCHNCMKSFTDTKTFENHECDEPKNVEKKEQ